MAIKMSMDEYNQRLTATPDDGAKHDVLYEAHQHISQLEALNTLLAEQVDRMDKVVKAAKTWAGDDKGFTRIALRTAVINYMGEMAQLAKEGE
jgi:hypothetical protein